MPRKTRTITAHKKRTPTSPSAPAVVHQLINAYVDVGVDASIIDAAYRHAGETLKTSESAFGFIEPTAEATLARLTPKVLESEIWGQHAGEIYADIGVPAFALGFTLAHLLFSERALTHPEFFERLRTDGLYNAFRSLDERRQRKVIRLANELAMQRTRELSARAAVRGKNVVNRTGWIGGTR